MLTGVILATGFAHLLQDAFEALRDPIVLERWKLRNHTGLIMYVMVDRIRKEETNF